MKKSEIITYIQETMKEEEDINLSKGVIKKILELEEEKIIECVENQDSITLGWGRIYGDERYPRPLSGWYRTVPAYASNYYYSAWQLGRPNVDFEKSKIKVVKKPALEYFSQDLIRLTTAAYNFRKDAGLEEVPEYRGLTEEQILLLCKEADKKAKEEYKCNHSIYRKSNIERCRRRRELVQKPAQREFFENHKDEILPMGMPNWEGRQRDYIDNFIKFMIDDNVLKLVENQQLQRLEWLKAHAYQTNADVNKHPELDELIEKFKKIVEEKGQEVLPPLVREYSQYATYDRTLNRNFNKKYDEIRGKQIRQKKKEILEQTQSQAASQMEEQMKMLDNIDFSNITAEDSIDLVEIFTQVAKAYEENEQSEEEECEENNIEDVQEQCPEEKIN